MGTLYNPSELSIMQNKKKRIESLYLLKCVSSFFVVLIHTNFFLRDTLFFVAGIGTPCFLAITGYLLYSENQKRELEKAKKWALKCALLALFCNIVYGIAYQIPLERLLEARFWKSLIIYGTPICHVLWYLTSLCWALLIFAVMRKFAPKMIYTLPFLFILIYFLRNITDPHPLFHLDITFKLPPRNSILTSLTFLSTGYIIHKHYNSLQHAKAGLLVIILLTTSFAENYCYSHYFGAHGLYHLSTYPLIVAVFILCIKHPDFKLPILNRIGKMHSPNIYYFHMLVIYTVWDKLTLSNDWQTPLIWLGCIPLSMVLIFLRKKIVDFWNKMRTTVTMRT